VTKAWSWVAKKWRERRNAGRSASEDEASETSDAREEESAADGDVEDAEPQPKSSRARRPLERQRIKREIQELLAAGPFTIPPLVEQHTRRKWKCVLTYDPMHRYASRQVSVRQNTELMEPVRNDSGTWHLLNPTSVVQPGSGFTWYIEEWAIDVTNTPEEYHVVVCYAIEPPRQHADIDTGGQHSQKITLHP
jgi:hypothetical protein